MQDISAPRHIPLSTRRLNKPYMYKKVFEGGRSLRSEPFTLKYIEAEELSRVGFIIRKTVGGACFRNSIRRTLRRSFQEALPALGEGTWIVFDVSGKAARLGRSRLKTEADKLLGSLSGTRKENRA